MGGEAGTRQGSGGSVVVRTALCPHLAAWPRPTPAGLRTGGRLWAGWDHLCAWPGVSRPPGPLAGSLPRSAIHRQHPPCPCPVPAKKEFSLSLEWTQEQEGPPAAVGGRPPSGAVSAGLRPCQPTGAHRGPTEQCLGR